MIKSIEILLAIEPVWVLLLIPSLILPEYFWEEWAYPWAIVLLFLFWPIRLVQTKRIAPPSPINLPITLLLLWAIVGTFFSPFPEQSILALGNLASGVALYFAVVNAKLLQKYPLIVALVLGSMGLLLAAIGPAILVNIPNKLFTFDPEFIRSKPIDIFGTGETINSNILAGNLLLAIPLTAALAIYWKWGSHRLMWRASKSLLFTVAVLLMMGTLILSQSRGSYMAIIVALVTLFTLRWRWTLLLVAVVVVSAISVTSWNDLQLLAEAIGSDGSITSLSGRTDIWVGSFFAILNYPLWGVGFGAFDKIMPQLLQQLTVFDKGTIPHAHNLLLQVGLDLGMPGLFFYLWLWVATFVASIQAINFWHSSHHEEIEMDYLRLNYRLRRSLVLRIALSEGVLATLLALFLHGIVDVTIWGTKLSPFSWLLFSLASLLYLPYAEINKAELNNQTKAE